MAHSPVPTCHGPHGLQELAYYNKLTECSEKQLTLEETACELHARRKWGISIGISHDFTGTLR